MVKPIQPDAIIYHYSSEYRDVTAEAVETAGFTPQVFDDPEAA